MAVKFWTKRRYYATAGCDWHEGSRYDRVQRFYVWNNDTVDSLDESIGPIVTRGTLHEMVEFKRLDDVDNLIAALEKRHLCQTPTVVSS